MTISRYGRTAIIGAGQLLGTSEMISAIRSGIKSGDIRYTTATLAEHERLDTISAKTYNDSTLWWIIAAASNIGFITQCPPGTNLTIPSIDDILKFI